MDNDLVSRTYKVPLLLQREDKSFSGGLCFCSAELAQLSASSHLFLHQQEREVFSKLLYPKRQYSYLLGRYCAKESMRILCETAPTDVLIENGVFQQPIVQHPTKPNLQVSISHSQGIGGALAFPEAHPMALDLEMIYESKRSVIATQLTESEKQLLASSFNNDIAFLTLAWTTKEALSKVLKCGFMVSFDLLEIEKIEQHNHFTVCYFKHFHQYQVLSFSINDSVCSIVYPKKTQLSLDILQIQNHLKG